MWRERCGSSGVAAAADGSSWAEPAGGDQSEGRACVRAGALAWRAHLRGHQRGRGAGGGVGWMSDIVLKEVRDTSARHTRAYSRWKENAFHSVDECHDPA